MIYFTIQPPIGFVIIAHSGLLSTMINGDRQNILDISISISIHNVKIRLTKYYLAVSGKMFKMFCLSLNMS
jgi:hypothetical protein